jgi:hypothetical protein
LHEDGNHRLAVAEGRAEITVKNVAQVAQILNDQWTVVARRVPALGQLLGRQASTEGGGDGVTGDSHEEEHRGDQDEDGRKDQQESDEQIAE